MANNIIRLGNSMQEAFIETGTELSIKFDNTNLLMKSTFVGKEKDQYIVVTPPPEMSTIENPMSQSDGFSISYGFEGDIFTFRSRLIRIIESPLKLLILKYPISVDKKELRAQKRISCFISAKIEVNHLVKDGVIKDVSKRGCRFVFEIGKEGPKGLQPGDLILLSFCFPGIIDPQDMRGEVKDIQINNSQLEVGIEFSENAWWIPPYG